MHTPGTIANSQRTPTDINKNGTIARVRLLWEQVMMEDIYRHNSVLLVILC